MNKSSESGNVIFYILIAVALLGALSFAVVQGERGSVSTLNDDKARLYASEIIEYGDIVKKAALQLRLRGTPLSSLSFAHGDADAAYGVYDADADNEIFNPEGGGVIYKTPPIASLASAGAVYEFYGSNEIEDVALTCATTDCAELILALSGLEKDVCVRINALMGVDNPSDNPPTDTQIDKTRFAGAFSYVRTIGDEAGSSYLEGQTAGCFLDSTASLYVFYQVLISR